LVFLLLLLLVVCAYHQRYKVPTGHLDWNALLS